jgi:dihydroneopterin triphosphate diphosphatase
VPRHAPDLAVEWHRDLLSVSGCDVGVVLDVSARVHDPIACCGVARAPFQVVVVPFRLRVDDYAYAMFRRADDDAWQWIAGGGEDSETPAQAARREAFEEAGVSSNTSLYRLRTVDSVPVSDFVAQTLWPSDTYVIPQYFFACDGETLAPTLSAEHSEWRWANYQEAFGLLRYDGNRTALFELAERLRRDDLPEAV